MEAKVTALGLRQREKRAAGGPTWHAQGRRLGDKNKKRKEAAKAALTLASPAGVPPSEPRPKRPAAVAADAALRAELEAGLKLDRELFTAAGSGIITEANTHKAWAYYYVSVLGCAPEEDWDTRITGTVRRRSKLMLLLLLLCCCGAVRCWTRELWDTARAARGGFWSNKRGSGFLYRINRLGPV